MFLKNTRAGVVCFNLLSFPGPQIPAFCRTPYVCHTQIYSYTLEHRYENDNSLVCSKSLRQSALLRALLLKKTQIMWSESKGRFVAWCLTFHTLYLGLV